MSLAVRTVSRIVHAQATSDGAGVRLYRSLGLPTLDYLDPFLLLDEFKSDTGRTISLAFLTIRIVDLKP